MARTVAGVCPSCGAALKVKEHAVRARMRVTCRCSWSGMIRPRPSLVARGEELRLERIAAWNRRKAESRQQSALRPSQLFALAGSACLLFAYLALRLPFGWRMRLFVAILLATVGVGLLTAATPLWRGLAMRN